MGKVAQYLDGAMILFISMVIAWTAIRALLS